MHHVLRAADMPLHPAHAGHGQGFRRCSLVDGDNGSVHTDLGLCALDAGEHLDQHVQSYEETFYVLEGEPLLFLDGSWQRLFPGACGLIPIGMPHAWRGPATGTARWIDMLTPLPRKGNTPADTFFLGAPPDAPIQAVDIRDPRSRHLFRMAENEIVLDNLKAGARVNDPTVSSSMATALLAYSGIVVKMLVDQRLGAQLSTMFMVEYQPGGVAHPHDHPLEESYFILQGEVEAVADDIRYTLKPGDLLWTGVGCIHAFYNTSPGTVRWLETQSPQPPAQYSYRFSRDWAYLEEKLGT